VTDYLAELPEPRVAAWYARLADRIAMEKVQGREPLASQFLRWWVQNRSPTATMRFDAPAHLRAAPQVVETLRFHRAVFLTEEKARTGQGQRWAGVLPRIQGRPGFATWPNPATPLLLEYESLVEIGGNLISLMRIQQSGSAEERDLLTSLRGFQLRSKVSVIGRPQQDGKIQISFLSWTAQAKDRYDWNYNEHFTVPNPDYRSSRPDAVRPQDQSMRVYHRNAQRLERAGLAAPYDLLSNEWPVTDQGLLAPALVDPRRSL
jgi:hypothetical protein